MSTNSNAILLRYVVANAIQWIAKNRAMVVKIILVIASLTCYFEIQFNLMRSVVPSSNHNMIDDNQHRHLSMQQQQQQQSQQQQYRSSNSRVLMGIFTADMYKELRYRQAYRELLQTQYPKVCSLHDYKNAIQNTNNMLYDSTSSSILLQHCTLIYTFVLGDGNPNGPTMIVSNETYRSVTVSAETIVSSDTKKKKNNGAYSIDFNSTDMTFLNIKENMNDGKSQTWLYYATIEMDALRIDYVMKTDTDTIPYLDRYFTFCNNSLPPYPYNKRVLASAPVDKSAWWSKDIMTPKHNKQKEVFFSRHYGSLHLYAAGQMYIMSHDLAQDVISVAGTLRVQRQSEGHEDHDVSLMAYLGAMDDSPDKPITFVMLPYGDLFYLHNVKIKDVTKSNTGNSYINRYVTWKRAWDNEIRRIQNINLISSEEDGENYNNSMTEEESHLLQQDSPSKGSKFSIKIGGTVPSSSAVTTTDNEKITASKKKLDKSDNILMKLLLGNKKIIQQKNTSTVGTTKETTYKDNGFNDYVQLLVHEKQQDIFTMPLQDTNDDDDVSRLWVIKTFSDMVPELYTTVDIDNTIGDNNKNSNTCFISENGDIGRPIKVTEFNAEGGMYYKQLYAMISSNAGNKISHIETATATTKSIQNPDIIILNEMDMNITIRVPSSSLTTETTAAAGKSILTQLLRGRGGDSSSSTDASTSDSIHHTTKELAKLLRMNYAWGIESIIAITEIDPQQHSGNNNNTVDPTNSIERVITFRGNAILSKCAIFDPQIIRRNINEQVGTSFRRLRGRDSKIGMGLFVRTGRDDDTKTNNIVIGSVHNMNTAIHRKQMWEYIYQHPLDKEDDTLDIQNDNFAYNNDANYTRGIPPRNQIGTIVSGDSDKSICHAIGLHNIDGFRKMVTYPADCANDTFGKYNTVAFCSDIAKVQRFKDLSTMPCYYDISSDDATSTTSEQYPIQLSRHGIINMMLQQ